jgi:hypothetical protein
MRVLTVIPLSSVVRAVHGGAVNACGSRGLHGLNSLGHWLPRQGFIPPTSRPRTVR